ncbi:MAG: PASTA domain-containing protein [Clostridia bacterium]|nr:PASTA domain-containing protein [Clostridia bacterium]
MSILSVKKRMKNLAFAFICVLVILVIWLCYQSITLGERYREAAERQQTKDIEVAAKRGTIYDRNKKQLAVSVSADTVILDPALIRKNEKAEKVASALSEILDMSYEDVYKVTQKESSYEILKKRITQEESKAIKELKDKTGIMLEEDTKRNYVYGSLAANILGFTGYDNQGLDGLESVYDSVLSGKNGRKSVAVANGGIELPYAYEQYVDPENGKSLVLTIDETIQHIAESRLNEAINKYGVKEEGCVIVMNPNTAEILAMAATPGYDPNAPFEIYDEELLSELEGLEGEEKSDAKGKAQYRQWRNKAVSDTYEPGSVFKIITAAACLEEGIVDENTAFNCPGSMHVAGWNINCWRYYNPHGIQNIEAGLANSCNCVFMTLGLNLGGERFREYVKAFGFEEKTGINLPGESEPIIRNQYADIDVATAAFGQNINVTPIQMITAVSSVINGGELLKPMIVKEYLDEDGKVTESFEKTVVRRVISEKTSESMKKYLEGVVKNGTGSGAKISGQRVGGKTGTSEKQPRDGRKIASFCGFAPANDPEIIVLVMLDEPTPGVGEGNINAGGGQIAAPTAGLIIDDILRYMGIEAQYSESEILSSGAYIPDLTGLSRKEAEETAKNSGFNINLIGGGDKVTDQQPLSGIMLSEGSTIIVYTEGSSEAQLTTVPSVTGMSRANAEATIKGANLNFRNSDMGAGMNGGVIASEQSPAAGEVVEMGTVVYVKFVLQDVD